MDAERRQQVQQEEDARKQAAADRQAALLAADYSQSLSLDALYGDLSVAEIKLLYASNASFKARTDEFNAGEAIVPAASLPDEEPPTGAAAAVSDDVDTAAAVQAEADRLAAEAAAAGVVPTVPKGSVEELYDGIEKLSDGNYKLTVDPEDGTPAEIFYGATQKDCFKALRRSKASATKELRRRAKKVQITDELRALKVEVMNYAPRVQPLILTPDQIFELTEQTKDPVTVLEATRKLRQASLTQEECDRQNEAIERQRYSDGYNIAISWINTHNEFYNCPENIEAMQDLMAALNWGVTINNLNLAFETLKAQGVLLDAPVEDPSSQPLPAQPASVVPVAVAVPVVPVAAPAAATVTTAPAQAAPAGALPAATKVLRPGSSSTATMPTRRVDSIPNGSQPAVLTVEEYNAIPAATAKRRYNQESGFRAAVDALIASGKI